MNKLTRCKLKKSIQIRLLVYFVLEVTARSAANMLGIQASTAILFYKKLRQIISYHLAVEASEIFDGCVELDESYFGGVHKGERGRGAAGKVALFGILKRGGNVYTVVVKTPSRQHSCPSSLVKSHLAALFIPTPMGVIMLWM